MEDEAPADEREALSIVAVPYYKVGKAMFRRVHALPNLRLLQIPSAGYEHAVAHVPPGVSLASARGVHDAGTSEMAIGLALAVLRGIDDAARDMVTGTWRWRELTSLADRRCLIVGYGSIGAAIGERLEAMEAEVVAVARTARTIADDRIVHGADELPTLLGSAEVVFVVTPLSDETRHLVDARFLAAMPDGALLVSIGRGGVVDQEALLVEVASGRLRAALDVTDPEPLPPDHPLWRTPGVLITPHIGGAVRAADRRFAALLRRQVEAIREGREPENVVAIGPKASEPNG
ncbi:MAG: 2-hydroxyacid dehydrogenase [Demequinaceae bacterium]|nr:2-hydroxyacid dehydrogenase [Demequinaceae bacterium]